MSCRSPGAWNRPWGSAVHFPITDLLCGGEDEAWAQNIHTPTPSPKHSVLKVDSYMCSDLCFFLSLCLIPVENFSCINLDIKIHVISLRIHLIFLTLFHIQLSICLSVCCVVWGRTHVYPGANVRLVYNLWVGFPLLPLRPCGWSPTSRCCDLLDPWTRSTF